MNNKALSQLSQLIYAAYDGTISKDQMDKLNAILLDSAQARQYYYDYIDIITGTGFICSNEKISDQTNDDDCLSSCDKDFLSILAREEDSASTVNIEAEEVIEPAKIETVKDKPIPYKPGKMYYLNNAVFSTAAALLIFFIIYTSIFPAKPVYDVATVVDQMDVVWADSSDKLASNDRLFTHMDFYEMQKGIIKIRYDQGVDLVIEGPAKFEIDRLGIYLQYGKLYSYVTKVGYGFTVDCPNSRFVDLGTEFGVLVDKSGSSELHVLTGEVQLYAGPKGEDKVTFTAAKGSAWRYDAVTKTTDSIIIKTDNFARNINSDSGHIWRGQSRINLADIVGGGNGLGTGELGSGINPYRGEHIQTPQLIEFKKVPPKYVMVESNPFVDGTFVPNGKAGGVQINSDGHSYGGFKTNNGDFRSSFMYGPSIRERSKFNAQNGYGVNYYVMDHELNGITYGTIENPAIYSHTNSGITFDLAELRKAYPNRDILRLETVFGIPEKIKTNAISRNEPIDYDVYIFADSDCIYNKNMTTDTPVQTLALDIPVNAHFMTIAVVDSDTSTSYEWCIFGCPELILE